MSLPSESHQQTIFICDLSDWAIWNLMQCMPDQELARFSSTCRRFRFIAKIDLARRQEIKLFTDIVFKADDGRRTRTVGSNGRPMFWTHPLEVIDAISHDPRIANLVTTINTLVLCLLPGTQHHPEGSCYDDSYFQHLRSISNLNALVDQLDFLPADRKKVWANEIRELRFTPALLVLILLCPKLKSLTLKSNMLDSLFEGWITDFMLAARPVLEVSNVESRHQLTLPPVQSLSLAVGISDFLPVCHLSTIALLSRWPQLKRLEAVGVTGAISPTHWPATQALSLEEVVFSDSNLLIAELIKLISEMPLLKSLLCSQVNWHNGYGTWGRGLAERYAKELMVEGAEVFRQNGLVAEVIDVDEVLDVDEVFDVNDWFDVDEGEEHTVGILADQHRVIYMVSVHPRDSGSDFVQ